MLEEIKITTQTSASLVEFLEERGFVVEKLTKTVHKVQRDDELPVFIQSNDGSLYFEVDLGNVSGFASQDLYFKFLDLNTEILPVSVGIDCSNPDDPRLVLVESREAVNLDDNELMSVFNAFEIATDKVETILAQYVN